MGEGFRLDDLKDPERLKFLIVKYAKTEAFKVWGGFTLVAFIVFMLFSSGDFSFLLTLSSLVSVFSFVMVALKIETGRSCKGVSLRMMECYLAIFLFRLFAIVPFEGYLPFDKSGDWFYQTCEALGLCLAGVMVYFAGSATPPLTTPALTTSSTTGWRWAQTHTSHFLAAQALAKIMSFIFWASSFNELSNPNHSIKAFVGNWVVCTQLVQLLVMGDFIYHYIRCIRQGIPVSQLLCSDNV
eukprot:CAMPEP_0181489396 /NCGR_PEP_ID=MMETSP1110-20121109/48954_1 /TAXON_ID=174948 /ORGANISM="Symbiodinium sp., Strain CCMP421" /LENGTH=240 /DNA_ID=CAMNT_0023616215 /DNA_START=56 /DNA_END=779 /DNA_ORIENTATION=-